jgi:hypothetical protein
VFLSLICLLHTPMFAAFRNRSMKGDLFRQRTDVPSRSHDLLWVSAVLLAVPLLVGAVFQFSGDGDWRMIVPNSLICGAIWALLLIAR